MSWFEATYRWYGVLFLLSVAWAPFVLLLCRRLPDHGVTLLRPLALLGTIYPSWVLAQTIGTPYATVLLVVTAGIVAVAGWILVVRQHLVSRQWIVSLMVSEAIALAAFALLLWLRGFTPAIMNTEKPMEAAFLSSSRLTTSIPPPDPWFAGEPINYYYLGYLLHGSIARLADVPATTAFNLALATTFSASVVAAAGLGWNLARPWFGAIAATWSAAMTVVFIMVAGNVYAALQLLSAPAATLNAGWWDTGDGIGWRASRIICDGLRVGNDCSGRAMTINEFPSFSFILGDLHPHVLALPFVIIALNLAFAVLLIGRAAHHRHLAIADWLRIGTAGAILGSLYALNSWDFPTVLGIAALGLLWATGRWWVPVATLVAASIVAWLPFIATYTPPASPAAAALPEVIQSLPLVPRVLSILGLYTGPYTSIGEFLTIFGVPYMILLALLADSAWRERTPMSGSQHWLAATAIMTTLLAIALSAPLLIICGWPLAIAIALLRKGRVNPRTLALGLMTIGLALVVGAEFFYILDIFNSRMNTLFKFYYQVWTLFGLASALALLVLWQSASRRRPIRWWLVGVATVGILAGLVSPLLSARAWTTEFAEWQGLDGIAYVSEFSTGELAAVRWLQENVTPSDVILEAAGCSYQVNGGVPMGRAATFSGAPTIIGWDNHERQWRAGQPDRIEQIPSRQGDVAAMFANPRSPLFEDYGITLLYVGRYERDDWQRTCQFAGPYPNVSAETYPGVGWTAVFTENDVAIFRRDSSDR